MPTTPWDRFDMAVENARTAWNKNRNRPLGSAYERALKKYNAKLVEQAKADQATAENRAAFVMLEGGKTMRDPAEPFALRIWMAGARVGGVHDLCRRTS